MVNIYTQTHTCLPITRFVIEILSGRPCIHAELEKVVWDDSIVVAMVGKADY